MGSCSEYEQPCWGFISNPLPICGKRSLHLPWIHQWSLKLKLTPVIQGNGPLLSLSTGLVSLQFMIKDDRNTEHYLLTRLDNFCQLIKKQTVNLLVPGPWTKPSVFKRKHASGLQITLLPLWKTNNKIKETLFDAFPKIV